MVEKMYTACKAGATQGEELKVFNTEKEAINNYIETCKHETDYTDVHVYELKLKRKVDIEHHIKIVNKK
jgi:hypothetical protein